MNDIVTLFRKNRTLLITLAILILLFVTAIRGMDTRDWVITLLRGLSVGAITFIVASGFSLIFGLLDVLNLAHGTLFMVGAYIGWTVFVRPDTFVDAVTPVALLLAGFILLPVWRTLLKTLHLPVRAAKAWPWAGLAFALAVLAVTLPNYPITAWDPGVYDRSPITYSLLADQGMLALPARVGFENASPFMIMTGILAGGILASGSIAGFGSTRQMTEPRGDREILRLPWKPLAAALGISVIGITFYLFNDAITDWLVSINRTWLFLLAMIVASGVGALLGTTMETGLIRPLYSRPIYQLMMTLGLSVIGIEVVRAVWGRPEFTMPKPPIFNGTGEGCPATSLADLLANQCSTISILGGRVRTYNEVFIPLVGMIVLVSVWLLLQRSRLGMIIRAGVQDSEMVEALGINVRRVFTLVFALGVGLAALGGVIAAPSMGLSSVMGDTLLLNALIALAIGGLTSFPGAAAGSLLVGLLQQFIIRYGQIGINIPFTEAVFKPTPPLVPASTVLLMVIILLVLPHGLFGRKE
jgi:branched-chain amino acid transport system permease protein